MSDYSEEEKQILAHLSECASRGQRYFRAKNIAKHLGLSPKQVGVRLPKLAEKAEDVEIEKWGRARSTTWKVSPI